MSRSNPNDHAINPATRWYEWNGEVGAVRYYDKEAKRNVDVALPFEFLLLDELGSVRGWHDASQSGIYANEVRDTRQDVMVVKAFKGGTLAEGLYKDIKDRVNVAGGSFTANCYIGFKGTDGLELGAIRFKGAALGSWMEWRKAHRQQLYKQAIAIVGFTEGQKGRVIYRMPTFALKPLSDTTNAAAIALDKELQDYLSVYLSRTKKDQVESTPDHHLADEDVLPERVNAPSDDEIPFAWLLPLVLPALAMLGVMA